jgi:hypothetical protein
MGAVRNRRERKGNNHRAQPPKLYTPEELKIKTAAAAAAAAAEAVGLAARNGDGAAAGGSLR